MIDLNTIQFTNNQIIDLEPNQRYVINDSRRIDKDNVVIRRKPRTSGNNPIIEAKFTKTTSSGSGVASPAFIVNGSNVVFDGFNFGGRTYSYLANVYGKNTLFERLKLIPGTEQPRTGGLVQILGGRNVAVQDIDVTAQYDRYLVYSGNPDGSVENGRYSNFVLSRLRDPYGSLNEHCVRLHNFENSVVQDCALHMDPTPRPKNGHPLNIRDGKGLIVQNVRTSGYYSVIGPLEGLAIDPNTPAGKYAQALRAKDVTIRGSQLGTSLQIFRGVENLVVDDTCIVTSTNKQCIAIDNSVHPLRPSPSALFRRVKGTQGNGVNAFIGGRLGSTRLEDCTFNGSPVT